MQTFLMAVIVIACITSAGLWLAEGNAPAAVAFGGFAFGYVGLAWLFA